MDNEQCVDYADGGQTDACLLWNRNNGTQQRWSLEIVPQSTFTPISGQVRTVNNTGGPIENFIYNGNGSFGWLTIAAGDSWSAGSFANPCCLLLRRPGVPPSTTDPFTSHGEQVPVGSVVTITGFHQAFNVQV